MNIKKALKIYGWCVVISLVFAIFITVIFSFVFWTIPTFHVDNLSEVFLLLRAIIALIFCIGSIFIIFEFVEEREKERKNEHKT